MAGLLVFDDIYLNSSVLMTTIFYLIIRTIIWKRFKQAEPRKYHHHDDSWDGWIKWLFFSIVVYHTISLRVVLSIDPFRCLHFKIIFVSTAYRQTRQLTACLACLSIKYFVIDVSLSVLIIVSFYVYCVCDVTMFLFALHLSELLLNLLSILVVSELWCVCYCVNSYISFKIYIKLLSCFRDLYNGVIILVL